MSQRCESIAMIAPRVPPYMRIWLDDARPIPAGYTIHVKTANDAIACLATGRVKAISLDHDLGDEDVVGSGYQVACWIEEQASTGKLPLMEVAIHSANPVGVARMRMAIARAVKAWAVPVHEQHQDYSSWSAIVPSTLNGELR